MLVTEFAAMTKPTRMGLGGRARVAVVVYRLPGWNRSAANMAVGHGRTLMRSYHHCSENFIHNNPHFDVRVATEMKSTNTASPNFAQWEKHKEYLALLVIDGYAEPHEHLFVGEGVSPLLAPPDILRLSAIRVRQWQRRQGFLALECLLSTAASLVGSSRGKRLARLLAHHLFVSLWRGKGEREERKCRCHSRFHLLNSLASAPVVLPSLAAFPAPRER